MYSFLTIGFILSLTVSNQLKENYRRVRHGEDVKEGEYTYVILIVSSMMDSKHENVTNVVNFRRHCTGSMLSDQWALTAGHCVARLQHKDLYVWYKNYTVSPLATHLYSRVLKIFLHPKYKTVVIPLYGLILDNDISVLRVRKINLKTYGMLSTVDYKTLIGLPVTYVGGGETDKTGDDNLRPLQVGEAVVVTCDEKMLQTFNILICITPKYTNKLNRAWDGDSGAPLIRDGQIIGVCSVGAGIVADGYSPTSLHVEWIHNVMRSEE